MLEKPFRFAWPVTQPNPGIFEVTPDESGLDMHIKVIRYEGKRYPGEPFAEEVMCRTPKKYAALAALAHGYACQKAVHVFLTTVANKELQKCG